MNTYHLYMDESGEFEGVEKRIARQQSALLALLVPDENHDALVAAVRKLWSRHGVTSEKRHAMANQLPPDYLINLIGLVAEHGGVVSILRHEEDRGQGLPEDLGDAYAANRYTRMATCLLEHLFFLHPDFLGRNLAFSLHPNSRVTVFRKEQKDEISRMREHGYSSKEIEDLPQILFFSWSADMVRTEVLRLALDYAPWIGRIGQRSFPHIETVVAKNSDNPLVHVADHLANLCRSDVRKAKKLRPAHDSLHSRANLLRYGRRHEEYRSLVRLYLAGDIDEFLPETLYFLARLDDRYYRASLQGMVKKLLTNLSLADLSRLKKLERLVDDELASARGNWRFVLELLDPLITAVRNLEKKQGDSLQCHQLLFRLYGQKMRIHNHRGEDVDAWEAYENIEGLALGRPTVDLYRAKVEVENRFAVTLANIFAFEEGVEKLAPLIAALEKALLPLAEAAGTPLDDPLVGKLRGTMAQSLAFLAPRQPELFAQAESVFLRAAAEFAREHEQIRHEINLLHLYLDWGRNELADAIMDEMAKRTPIAGFLADPSRATARSMQFVLAVFLKYCLRRNRDVQQWLERCPLSLLMEWFGDAANEHPFQFICANLGRMAFRMNEKKRAAAYFKHALKLPFSQNPREQATLQALRAQTNVWWAMELATVGDAKAAGEKMVSAVESMRIIGSTKGLETMLHIEDNGVVSGWFASGWQALVGVDWPRRFDMDACAAFLRCFTFNYH